MRETMSGAKNMQLRTPEVMEFLVKSRADGLGYVNIAKALKEKFGIETSFMTVKNLLRINSLQHGINVKRSTELTNETEAILKKSLGRINESSDMLWEAIQKFKDPEDAKAVYSLTTLIRSLKDNIEVNLRYIGGDYTKDVNVKNQINIQYNDVNVASRVAKQIDILCKNCPFKHPRNDPISPPNTIKYHNKIIEVDPIVEPKKEETIVI